MQGVIFNIQEYSVGDGPGIRTTVFLKGCPLRCAWCCNPEGQNFEQELTSGGLLAGKSYSPRALFERIKTASAFFKNSGGGVTLSGGEPLAQPAFVKEFLRLCKKGAISVGVETCGYFDRDKIKDFIGGFDFYYFDIKTTGPEIHEKHTGKDNKIILENLKNLAKNNSSKITITITVIPGVNDSKKMITEIAGLCKRLKITKIRLLPYHAFGKGKYENLGRKYKMPEGISVNSEELEQFKKIIQHQGIKCWIE